MERMKQKEGKARVKKQEDKKARIIGKKAGAYIMIRVKPNRDLTNGEGRVFPAKQSFWLHAQYPTNGELRENIVWCLFIGFTIQEITVSNPINSTEPFLLFPYYKDSYAKSLSVGKRRMLNALMNKYVVGYQTKKGEVR